MRKNNQIGDEVYFVDDTILHKGVISSITTNNINYQGIPLMTIKDEHLYPNVFEKNIFNTLDECVSESIFRAKLYHSRRLNNILEEAAKLKEKQ